MKRITTNDDIRFPIRVVKGLDSDIFTIQFYTTSRAVCLTKTNADVEDGIIHLEWTELYPLGTGVLNYTVLIPEEDGSYSDDTFNKSISGTTIFYIVSDIIVPDGDEAQELVEVVADLQTQVNANTAKIEELMKVTITSSNWSATALQTPDTRYIISGNLDFDSATEVEVGDNCQIEFTKGSTLGSNVELLINNAEIVAPLTQIFDGTKITGFFHNGQIPVEWFGAKGDGETDDAEAINTTIKYAGKSEVLLSAPIYVIGSTINIDEGNANFDTYEGQIEAAIQEEGGKKFLCKGSIYSTSNFTGFRVGNKTIPAMVRLAASNATVRIEGAIVVHADLTECIGFLHVGYHDNKVYIARVMKARDYIGVWSWLDGTTSYTNQALMNLGTCDGVVYIYAMGGDFESEQICGFNNAFMVSDKYARAYAGVQQSSFKFASLTANYGIRVKVGRQDGIFVRNTKGWMNACRIEYNGISGSNESRRFIPTTDATLIKVDSGTTTDHFCQNKIICNSVEPIWYKLMDINRGRGDYFEFLGNFGDCHVIPYRNGVPDDAHLGESAPTLCYNGAYPYTSTNKFINISNSRDFLINNLTPYYAMPYDTIYVHNSNNVVFTNCQSAQYLNNNYYQYNENYRRFEKVIFTSTNITSPANGTDITIFEPDKRETDTIAYVESANDIDLTVDRLNIVTTPAYTTKFNVYPLYQVINGVKSQLGYCYDYKGLIASNNTLEEALSHVTVDAYTKAETNTLLAGKADKNGSASEAFTVNSLNLMREGAATTLYNYIDANNKEYVSFYDRTGGSLTYRFTANQGDNIATERQLTLKANSSDVYSKSEVYTKGEVNNLIPDLPDNIVTDANYVHTDNNFTTTLKNKLDGIASGAEVNVQANWNETNSSSDAYIQNKPTNVSSFTNDAGYLTSYTETDPTVPSWAKAQNKPTYTASEVGALPDTTTIPSKVSDLTNDLGFVTGSKIYVGTCTTAAATMPKVCTVETFPTDANGKPLLGTVISVKFTATNTASSNLGLDVNGCGSAGVWYNTGVTTSKTYYGYAGRYITYMWDGTHWVFLTWGYDTNTTYSNVSLGQGYAVQSNSSASATITATLSSYALTVNGIVSVKFNYDVPANATLNINGKGAKAIYNKNAAITAGVIKAGDTATFIYNTYYRLIAVDSWQDNTGGGSGTGESKIVLYAIVDEDHSTCTIQTTEYETLTCSAVKALLNDPTKDVVLRTYDPNNDPNYIEYRLYNYYDDTDLEAYYFFYSDGSNIYTIGLEATRSYTDTWDCYTSTYTVPTSPGKLGIGFGTQNNTSTSSVSATANNYKKVVGGIVAIKFTKTLAHAPQLNINGTGSSYIYFRGTFCPANTIQSGDIATLMYTYSGTYEILSITTNRSNDASDVSYTASDGIIRVDSTRYKTYKIKDYSTTVPSGTTGIQFRFSKNTDYNTEPVTTLILRAENFTRIDWSTLDCSFYSYLTGTSTEVTIKWKDNDSPVNTLAHLGNGVDYVVIKVYEGEYGTYEAW